LGALFESSVRAPPPTNIAYHHACKQYQHYAKQLNYDVGSPMLSGFGDTSVAGIMPADSTIHYHLTTYRRQAKAPFIEGDA